MFHNCVPEEFTNSTNANYVARKDSSQLTCLRVMVKKEWLAYKQTVSSIRREVNALSFGEKASKPKELSLFETGSLLAITGLDGMSKL